jgi:hypothetical protein
LTAKTSRILENPLVKILLFIYGKEEVRYTDLTRIITSRETLSSNLKKLEINPHLVKPLRGELQVNGV